VQSVKRVVLPLANMMFVIMSAAIVMMDASEVIKEISVKEVSISNWFEYIRYQLSSFFLYDNL
jgi:hypothetical protein